MTTVVMAATLPISRKSVEQRKPKLLPTAEARQDDEHCVGGVHKHDKIQI
jgi:hypothetical protein